MYIFTIIDRDVTILAPVHCHLTNQSTHWTVRPTTALSQHDISGIHKPGTIINKKIIRDISNIEHVKSCKVKYTDLASYTDLRKYTVQSNGMLPRSLHSDLCTGFTKS